MRWRCVVLVAVAGCRLGDLVTPPAAGRLSFTVQPSDAAPDAAISPPVQVTVFDATGAPDTGYQGPVVITLAANPGGATVSGDTVVNAVHGVAVFDQLHIDQPGSGYVLRAVATGRAPAASAAFDVTTAALPPVAAFSVSCTSLSCAFTDGSSDADGTITAWSWTFGDGGSSSSQNPSHAYATAGSYSVRLIVTDNDGAKDTTSTSVTVSAANQPPTAAFSASCNNLTCDFTDASSDADGSLIAWSWSFGDGNTSTSHNPSHTYGAAGSYTVQVAVADDGGATDVTSKTVTVTAANQPPSVNAGPDVNLVVGLFTLNATFSDPDATDGPWSYTIDWGDGSTTTGSTSDQSSPITAGHTYLFPGQYHVRVTVTDQRGGSGSDETVVTVTLS